MATPKKTAQGTWRVQIEVKGVRDSATMPTRREALDWASRRALEIRSEKTGMAGTTKTLKDAFRKYAEEVSPAKKGERWELIRLVAFEKQGLPMTRPIAQITKKDMQDWRDRRLAINARGSVLRDMTLMSGVFDYAVKEWGWIDVSPMAGVRRPQEPDHREVLITGPQVRRMLRALGHGGSVRSVSQAVAVCFLLALSTGMRAGELCAVRWDDVRPDYLALHDSKIGEGRPVPLSPVGKRLVERMRGWDADSLFGLKSQTLDALFRRARERAGLSGFTFNDARHTAATRLAQVLHVLDLCKVFGWRDVKRAMTYYNPSPKDLARRLAALPFQNLGQQPAPVLPGSGKLP